MTIHTPRLLMPAEFAFLIELALHAPEPNVPPPKARRPRLVVLTAKGAVVTGDGQIRIAESE